MLATAALLLVASRRVEAQAPLPDNEPNGLGSMMTSDQARATVQSLVDLAIRKTPHQYNGKKNWEKTKKIWAGVRFRRDGLKLSTHRRWREVRHGLQTRYHVQFPGDASAPRPVIAEVRQVTHCNGDASQRAGWTIECELATPLDFSARIERWNLGVQWYSVEVSGHMEIRLTVHGRLSSYPDYSVLPPAIVIDPTVTSASLHLDALHVDRISKVGGEVAETWGEIVEKIVNEILIDDINEKLHAKLNKAIDKKRDDLRFSAVDWMSGFTSIENQHN
ncbi:hypothetical protein [Stieleria sp.]|uniref:Secreted protein n=2 Tax=Stieleria magnilauensis TaxID=2527963 RepID=A0ABX5XXL7_9BACT|nr:hypothetical protein TBK1r_57870 [Planctomycetes bacterium TBK1r]